MLSSQRAASRVFVQQYTVVLWDTGHAGIPTLRQINPQDKLPPSPIHPEYWEQHTSRGGNSPEIPTRHDLGDDIRLHWRLCSLEPSGERQTKADNLHKRSKSSP